MVDVPVIPPVSRDPKDDKLLITAAVAGAAYLVTEDNDLLVLGAYRDVQVVDAATFLAVLEDSAKHASDIDSDPA